MTENLNCEVTLTAKFMPSVLVKELFKTLTDEKLVYLIYCVHRKIKWTDEYALKFDNVNLRSLIVDTYRYYLQKYGASVIDNNLSYIVQNDRCLISRQCSLHSKKSSPKRSAYPYVFFANNFFIFLCEPGNENIDVRLEYVKMYSDVPLPNLKNNTQLNMVEIKLYPKNKQFS